MAAAILNGGMQSGLAEQQQSSAPHTEADIIAHRTHHAYSTGQHARGAICASAAFNQNNTTAHLVAHTIACIAGDEHGASSHALSIAGNGGGQEVTDIAVNMDQAACHTAGSEG